MANLHIQRPQFDNAPDGSENVLSELRSPWIVSRELDGGSVRYHLRVVFENREAVLRAGEPFGNTRKNLELEDC